MKLIELELDLAESSYLRETFPIKEWKWIRRDFQLMTRCMTSMVERLMGPIVTNNFWKILIQCSDHPTDPEAKNMLGVCVIQIEFNFEIFYHASDLEKKKIIIDTISLAIKKLEGSNYSNLEKIGIACNLIREKKYINSWRMKQIEMRAGNNAQLRISHDVKEVNIYLEITDKNHLLSRSYKVATSLPDEWAYSELVGQLEWVSDNKICLKQKNGKEVNYNINA